MAKISIIISTYNHLEDNLKPCLNSIFANTSEDYEVIVVSNGCKDGTADYVKSLNNVTVKSIDFKDPIGFPKANNEGIKVSTGEYIVLLNDDTVILGNQWINILKKPFDENSKAGITGPIKFLWDCGSIKRECIAFWCCMFKKSLIYEIGLLDERFSPGMGEDGDFSVKATMIGYELIQVPVNKALNFGEGVSDQTFPIYHKGNGTFSSLSKNEVIKKNDKLLESIYDTRLEKIYNICLGHECDINKLFPILRKYAAQCEHVTEFGVRGVFSTYAFLAAKPRIMRSFDINYTPNIEETKDVAKESGINFQFIQGDTRNIGIEETDLLFIDTLHIYSQLSFELIKHGNKARKYILLHDTFTWGEKDELESVETKQGLKLAIQEFLGNNPHWRIKEEITESNGLTILERMPAFSIIIPTCSDKIVECLMRVFQYTNMTDKEVIVVSNGNSKDFSFNYFFNLKRRLDFVFVDHKVGPAVAYNLGAKKARGKYIVLLDDDTFLLEQPTDLWINKLYSPFMNNESMGITGPMMADNYAGLNPIIHSGCAMYKKEAWDKVGGFNESFKKGYLSDSEISLNIIEKGFQMECVGADRSFPMFHPDSNAGVGLKAEDVKIVRENRGKLYQLHGKKPTISIVIPTYGLHLEDCLKPCIESIIKFSNLDDIEVIVVANGCKDGTAEYIDSLGYPFNLIWFDEGLGYTKATNLGIKASRGDYIVLLNNDAIILDMGYPKNTWLDMMKKPFEADEKVGITGPLQLYDNYSDRDVMIFFCVMLKRELFENLAIYEEIEDCN